MNMSLVASSNGDYVTRPRWGGIPFKKGERYLSSRSRSADMASVFSRAPALHLSRSYRVVSRKTRRCSLYARKSRPVGESQMPDPVKRPIGLVNRVERFEETAEAAWRLRN